MRARLLALPLLLAASSATAGEPAAPVPAVNPAPDARSNTQGVPAPAPAVKAAPDAGSNTQGAPAPAPAAKTAPDAGSNTQGAPALAPAVKAAPAAKSDPDDEEEAPPTPNGPVAVFALETLSAGLHWAGGALVGISAGNIALRGADRADDRRDLALGTAFLAGPFLAGWGAGWVGAYNDRPGRFWAAVGGAAAGEALGFGATRLVEQPSRLQEFLFPALGAAAGAATGTLLTSASPGGPSPAVAGGLAVDPDGGLALTLAGAF
jgi:hypothetical protein